MLNNIDKKCVIVRDYVRIHCKKKVLCKSKICATLFNIINVNIILRYVYSFRFIFFKTSNTLQVT